MKKSKILITQDQEDPVPTEILAASIRKIAKEMEAINQSGLNRRALLLLLSGATKLPMTDIDYVLNALSRLEELYCLPKRRPHG